MKSRVIAATPARVRRTSDIIWPIEVAIKYKICPIVLIENIRDATLGKSELGTSCIFCDTAWQWDFGPVKIHVVRYGSETAYAGVCSNC